MPIRNYTPHGQPCWIDVMTSDSQKSKEFYTKLFSWTAIDQGEQYGNYIMLLAKGKVVAGIGEKPKDAPYPDAWTTYLASDNVENTCAAVVKAGGTILMPKMQVGDQGSMAMIADPSGAPLGVWEAEKHAGYEITSEENTPVWHELCSKEYETAIDFYKQVFAWKTKVMVDNEHARYTVVLGEKSPDMLGVFDAKNMPGENCSYWTVSFGATDVAGMVEKAKSLGATVVKDITDAGGYGQIAIIADPTGANFMLHSKLTFP